MVVPLVYCSVRGRSLLGSVLTGLAGAGLLWLLAGLYAWANGAELILSRIAVTMMVGSPALVLFMTVVLAAAAGALAGGTGYSLRAVIRAVNKD